MSGLEGHPPSSLSALSPEQINELRRAEIRLVLQQNLHAIDTSQWRHSKYGAMTFIEMNNIMCEGWKSIDGFARDVFEDLADEGQGVYRKRPAEYNVNCQLSLEPNPPKIGVGIKKTTARVENMCAQNVPKTNIPIHSTTINAKPRGSPGTFGNPYPLVTSIAPSSADAGMRFLDEMHIGPLSLCDNPFKIEGSTSARLVSGESGWAVSELEMERKCQPPVPLLQTKELERLDGKSASSSINISVDMGCIDKFDERNINVKKINDNTGCLKRLSTISAVDDLYAFPNNAAEWIEFHLVPCTEQIEKETPKLKCLSYEDPTKLTNTTQTADDEATSVINVNMKPRKHAKVTKVIPHRASCNSPKARIFPPPLRFLEKKSPRSLNHYPLTLSQRRNKSAKDKDFMKPTVPHQFSFAETKDRDNDEIEDAILSQSSTTISAQDYMRLISTLEESLSSE